MGVKAAPANSCCSGLQDLRLPRGAQPVVLQLGEPGLAGGGVHEVEPVVPGLPQRAHLAQQRQGLLHAVFQQLGAGDLAGVVTAAQRQAAGGEEVEQPVGQLELVAQAELDVDALDAFGVLAHAVSGMTTSSLTLKALVWRAMAAVRLRSSQNFLRASALTATKPSPLRPLARRTTSLVARATASGSSPTMSPTSTIFGTAEGPPLASTPRLLLVA
jgi:hypothetical protein